MKARCLIFTGLTLALIGCSQASQNTVPTAPVFETTTRVKKATAMPQTLQIKSQLSFDDTVTKLRDGISKRPLKLFAEIDHAAGAATADLSLEPSTLFIFGNPQGGTPLMKRNPQMGIALPLKMHVYQDGEAVIISYTDIKVITESYGLDAGELPIPNIVNMLKGLAVECSQ